MKPHHFLKQLEHDRIVAAIADAEKKTSGQIRVLVSNREVDDPVAAAGKEFQRLALHRTPQRNAVLIFVAPRSHRFAVIGDQGVHEKCGEAFWAELTAAMSGHFKQGQFTEGLLHGIARAGELLAAHFPSDPIRPIRQAQGRQAQGKPDDKSPSADTVIED
ncbi:MAG TPA: TPM domain-containing protein [Opitutaceae bacterium]|jgi:uncharacterized membrane protein|nr:TPM domain-containing protein [Opitutaceae bacterium]